MSIQNTMLGTNPTTIFVSTANLKSIGPTGTSAVTTIHFCNTTLNLVTFDVYVVPSSTGTVGNDTMIYNTIQLAPEDTYILDTEKLMLDSGDQIIATASIFNAVTATVCFIGI